jgi:hypothetical protein
VTHTESSPRSGTFLTVSHNLFVANFPFQLFFNRFSLIFPRVLRIPLHSTLFSAFYPLSLVYACNLYIKWNICHIVRAEPHFEPDLPLSKPRPYHFFLFYDYPQCHISTIKETLHFFFRRSVHAIRASRSRLASYLFLLCLQLPYRRFSCSTYFTHVFYEVRSPLIFP